MKLRISAGARVQCRPTLILLAHLLIGASAGGAAAQTPGPAPVSSPPPSPPPASAETAARPFPWIVRPSLFLMATADENTDPPIGAFPVDFEEPVTAGNLGAGLDLAHRTSRTRFTAGLFGLVRSPISGSDRAVYVGGRIDWSWQLAPAWRIDISDSAKLQRQPQVDAAGFQRNNAVAGVEWRPQASPVGLSVQVADRRRSLPDLDILGFDRQSLTVGLVTSSATTAAEIGVGLQHYHAATATGRRLVLSAEIAKFGRSTIASARYALVDPQHDRPRPFVGEAGEQGEFSDIDRADFLEQMAFAGSDVTIANDLFVLDPIETDSDDWDFGRRKHVLVGYLSRTFGGGAVLSGSIRYQRRNGPNLLAPEGSALAAPFQDNRVAVRIAYRRPLSAHLTLIAQASYLRNRGDRPVINFSRQLYGIGLQVGF